MKKFHFDAGILFALFFLIIFLYTYITGCMNIVKRSNLEKYGAKVTVTVTDMEYDSVTETETYTFNYTYNEKDYVYKDTSDHTFSVGESFDMYIDPDNPGEIVLKSDRLYLSFIMLFMAMGFTYFSKHFAIIKKHLLTSIYIVDMLMLSTGVIIKDSGLLVAAVIMLIITFLLRKFIRKIEEIYG